MSRYDKYDPKVGGFRAKLAANWGYTTGVPDRNHADLNKVFAVGVDTSGNITKFTSAAATAFVGVMVLTIPKAAGDVVDIMTDGEIVELVDAEILGSDTLAAGQPLYADASVTTGQLVVTTGAGDFYVGRTIELNTTTGQARLVVRCNFNPEVA